jgi:hypothetical protein
MAKGSVPLSSSWKISFEESKDRWIGAAEQISQVFQLLNATLSSTEIPLPV